MWFYTIYGMFSVSCSSGELFAVRARNRAHLVNLQRRFPSLKACHIQQSAERDYRYRMFVSREHWVETVAKLAAEQTWDNFKDKAAAFSGADKEYVNLLHQVWSNTAAYQRRIHSPCSVPRSAIVHAREVAQEHAEADAACGRTWCCHCGACKVALLDGFVPVVKKISGGKKSHVRTR